jgi:hypothetical protein
MASGFARVDSTVATVFDRRDENDDDDEALFAELEEATESGDPTLAALREKRLEQLQSEMLRSTQARQQGTGSYTVERDEKAVMDITTSNKLAVVHFFRPEFTRCRVMDGHLEVRFFAVILC